MTRITIDEAVGLMINLDYIPTDFTVLDMTEAFANEAEEYYTQYRTEESKFTRDVCTIRHVLAQTIFDRINLEIASEHSLLDFDAKSELLSLDSLITWSIEEFGISIQCPPSPIDTQWQDVKIKIYDKHKIGLFINDKHEKTVHFRDIGLMGKNKNIPNQSGFILIGLSRNQKFPPASNPEGKHKKAISGLRNCLEKLTGISKDPFQKFNPKDGWRPVFKLIDDRRNADERAKKNAVHVSYKDAPSYFDAEDDEGDNTQNFDDEDDDAGQWISRNLRF
jgi:hypothetical protein